MRETTANVHGIVADVYRPLDENRVIVGGRVRWMDGNRILRDDPGIWALAFRDGRLFLSTPGPHCGRSGERASGARAPRLG